MGCSESPRDATMACYDFLASLDCGEFDFSTVYPDSFCQRFEVVMCDPSDYLVCIIDNSSCVDGVYTAPPLGFCQIPACD